MSDGIDALVGVIGTGTVGASWAAFFLARGFEVHASDPTPGAEQALRARVLQAWPALERLGIAPGASIDRLEFFEDLERACAGVGFVQESAPEREELKIELFSALDALCPREVILASSSSGLSMSRVQARCRHPQRCITAHPFNPPHLIPLVEVVAGAQTSPETIKATLDFYNGLGKVALHVRKEVVGHVANRLQAAVFREAVHLVRQGVVSVADVDAVLANGPGLRWALMGPLLTFHLAGGEGGMQHFLEHLGGALNSWIADLGSGLIEESDHGPIIEGVTEELGGRSIDELVDRRDEFLVELLTILRRQR